MFDVYTKEVVINGQSYRLRPLSGRYLPKLYRIISAMQEYKDDSSKMFGDVTLVEDLHTLIFETFTKSYPNESKEILDEFITQNFIKLVEVVISVNMPKQE